MAKVHLISLGCPKNRVDAEHMLGLALANGHVMSETAEGADTIVVNTCSFIGEAKKESIAAILEMGELKKQYGQKLIVSGCLAQRYAGELEGEMPEVDHFLGTSDFIQINALLDEKVEASAANFIPFSNLLKKPEKNGVTYEHAYLAKYDLPRVNSMPKYTAYLKVSEGCDNACAFCIIPTLRGKQRSRAIDDLVREAKGLAAQGVVELNLIAQDLTAFGHDLPGRPKLSHLLEALSQVEGIRWVRCMYAYPRTLTQELMHVLANGRNTLPYFDIPVQHASNKLLRRMRRGKDQGKLTELLLSLREHVPNLVLRSTLIVGFPGEDDADFAELLEFIGRLRFERLGVFKYSDEEGTTAYDLDGRVPYRIKVARYDKLMRKQRKIHKSKLSELVGQVHEAIVEGPSDEHPLLVTGRLWSQAPDIDGIAYLSSNRPLNAGEIVHVRITKAHDYDVVGEVLENDDPALELSMPFGARQRCYLPTISV